MRAQSVFRPYQTPSQRALPAPTGPDIQAPQDGAQLPSDRAEVTSYDLRRDCWERDPRRPAPLPSSTDCVNSDPAHSSL